MRSKKVQLGWSIDLLGLALSTMGSCAVCIPELKRLGLLEDIRCILGAAEAGGSADREGVEKLVGRLSHVAQVVAEGNAYLQPLYRLERARASIRKGAGRSGGVRAVVRASGHESARACSYKPRRLAVGAATEAARQFRAAVRWWQEVLRGGVSVPLAPRLGFPEIGDEGCAFVFTDAARESGTGFGGFSVVRYAGESRARFYYIAQSWDSESLQRLQANAWSMPAGEMFGAVMMLLALAAVLPMVSHLVCFTDSRATARAVTSNGSGAPQLHVLAQHLSAELPGVQLLGVHQPGKRNGVSDRLSRGRKEEVIGEAAAAGLDLRPLDLINEWRRVLYVSQSQPLREHG